ncbi:MAG: hypothetical protein MR503_01460 [Oscillospiraceae bacterium]|nr:hypothetical protein [Oscillospiraceae bacterium]
MKQKRTKRPVTASYEDIMFNEAGSANDCTGLIPSAVTDDSEYKSYEDIMDFDLPEMYKKSDK